MKIYPESLIAACLFVNILFSIEANAESGSERADFRSAYFVVQNGTIDKFDAEFKKLSSDHFGTRKVSKADITPDGKYIVLGIPGKSLPINIIDTIARRKIETNDFSILPLLSTDSEYMPQFVYAASSRYIYYYDCFFTAGRPRLLIDIESKLVRPLKDIGLYSPSCVSVSPNEETMLTLVNGSIKLVEVATGIVRCQYSLGDVTFERVAPDWNTMTVDANWYVVRDRKATSFAGTIQLDDNTVSSREAEAALHFKPEALRVRISDLLGAYERGISTYKMCQPVLIGRVAQAVNNFNERTLRALASEPEKIFISPKAFYLVAVSQEAYAERGEFPVHARAWNAIVIDLKTGDLLREFEFDDEVVAALFD